MKTNQIMTVSFTRGSLKIGHKDQFGSLRDLFTLGTRYRFDNNKPALRMESWLAMESTKEYIDIVSESIGRSAIKTKRGKNGGTWVHLRVLIDAAMYLDPYLKDEVITTFIENRLLDVRDKSGDDFIDLNATLALTAEDVLGKDAHRGHFITLANIIKQRCDVEDWNFAPPDILSKRSLIEDRLSTMLKAGVVKDWEHLKELAKIV
jgi:hypothetical protein